MVRKYAGRKSLFRCPVGSLVSYTRFTCSFPCPQAEITNHVGNAGFILWIQISGKVRTSHFASRFPSSHLMQVVGHLKKMLPSLNLLPSMANDGTRLPGRFLAEPMISVQSATRKPSIRPSVGTAVLSLKYRPIFLVGRDPWTTEEDERLLSAFDQHGNKWHTIANNLQGRPGWFDFAARKRRYSHINRPFSYSLPEPPPKSPAGQGNS